MKGLTVSDYSPSVELKGYIKAMPENIYHNTEGFISKSSLSALKESPFRFFNGTKKAPTKAMQTGTAIHCLLLEPEKFDSEYLLMPEVKAKTLKAYKDAVKDNPGKTIINGQDAINIEGMMRAVYNNDAAKGLLIEPGYNEVSGFGKDKDTGILLRHRFDRLTSDFCGVDIKKTQSAEPEELSKTIEKYGYDMQDALYSDQFEAITGHKLKQFYFIFVEETYPHKVAVVYLDDISKQVGRDKYKTLLNEYAYYSDNPGKVNNNNGVSMISLPEWSLRQYEESLENGGIY